MSLVGSGALAKLAPVAFHSWQFTRENIWPYIRQPGSVLDRLFPSRVERRQLKQFQEAARAYPPQDAVRLFASGHHASLKAFGDVSVTVQVVGVAPFGVRPHEIEHLKASGYHQGRQVFFAEVKHRALQSAFIGPGKLESLQVTENLGWFPKVELPTAGQAMKVELWASLMLAGPWEVEYGRVELCTSVWLPVLL